MEIVFLEYLFFKWKYYVRERNINQTEKSKPGYLVYNSSEGTIILSYT